VEKLPKEREHLVLDNLNMVHHVLNKKLHIHKGHPKYDDYFQEGVVGLIHSAIRFDESKGFQFSTFAIPYIHGIILKYKRDNDHLLHYPRKLKDVMSQIIQYINQDLSPEEISKITGINIEDVQDAISINLVTSLEQPVQLKNDSTKSIMISDTISDPMDLFKNMIDEEHVMDIIQVVSDSIKDDKWRGIWEEYIYGALYGEKLTQEYFATKYGVSQAHVSRKLTGFKENFIKELKSWE